MNGWRSGALATYSNQHREGGRMRKVRLGNSDIEVSVLSLAVPGGSIFPRSDQAVCRIVEPE